MWNFSNVVETQSELFEGNGLYKKLTSSLYGQFMKILEVINLNANDCPVPKIIVIGSESSGKSSLLENISKCQLFPKNATFGTKQPIHLILKKALTSSDISYSVTYRGKKIVTIKQKLYEEINKIASETENDIISEEILVEICELSMVHLEFYDLPGIRAYPPELEQKSKQLAEHYLSQENVIPICVIPATTPRVTSYVPLGIIKKYNKEQNTLLCLTMCDRLQPDNINELLLTRITGTTDEFNLNLFAGISAVINRSHRNDKTLIQSDKYESTWFNEKLYKDMPKNYPNRLKVLNNTNLSNLLSNIDNIYNQFMKNNWIPNKLAQIEKSLEKSKTDLYNIGFDPIKDLSDKKIFEHMIIETILKDIFKFVFCWNFENVGENIIEPIEPIKQIESIKEYFCETMDIQNKDDKCKIFFNHLKTYNKILSDLNIQRLERFVVFFNKLINIMIDKYIIEVYLFIDEFKCFIEYDRYSLTKSKFDKKFKTLCLQSKEKYCNKIFNETSKEFISMETFINLEEDKHSQKTRKELILNISKYEEAKLQIKQLEKIGIN